MQHPNREPHVDLQALLSIAVVAGAGDRSRLSALRDRNWPGGGDRSMPHAHDWLRRWGPRRMVAPLQRCACGRGRCPVCN